MPAIKSQRFKPYSEVRRSMTSMLNRTKGKSSTIHLAKEVLLPSPPKKLSFQSMFRRVVDSFASGLTLNDDKRVPVCQQGKLQRNRPKPAGSIPLSSDDFLMVPRQKAVGRRIQTRVLQAASAKQFHSPNNSTALATGLEDTMANAHIGDIAPLSALSEERHSFPLTVEVHTAASMDDSSESSHASSVVHPVSSKPFMVHAIGREPDYIPNVIVMASRNPPESLAGQFWKRKASRVHRVDGSSLEDLGATRKTGRSESFTPYSRRGGRKRRAIRSAKDLENLADDEAEYSPIASRRSV